MKMRIETPRLLLRPIIEADAAAMFEMDSNPKVLTYIPIVPQTDIRQSQRIVQHVQKQYQEHGIGRVAVVLKETNEFVGWSGFKWITEHINGRTEFHELGYRFLERHWGKGYATESAKACLEYAFNVLEFPVIYAYAAAEHFDSQKVLTKVGFKFIETFDDGSGPCHWYKCESEKCDRDTVTRN